MLASIVHRPGVRYPEADEFFSPSEAYPEYRHGHLARKPNPVYAMVRETFAQAGLDAAHFGTAAWNPLGGFIPPGSKVFLLCNFVHHRRRTESAEDSLGKCTHGCVLRAVTDYVLIALGPRSPLPAPGSRLTFGNAPLQSCDFERVLRETGAAAVRDFYASRGCPAAAKDLRLFVTERAISGRTRRTVVRDQAEGMAVELDGQSLLQELCEKAGDAGPEFRVVDYDPEFMRAWHDREKHRYLIHRDILDADVVLCVPKLKTHEKVGITCGLKGYVGIVGRKECLPHHRCGAPANGGDEYPTRNPMLSFFSRLSDWVYRRGPGRPFQGLVETGDHTLRRFLRKLGYVTSGAWPGNDTTWRMALDLARVAHYADRSGRMQDTIQRRNLTFVDGIVGGEGEGPLAPTAVASGCLVFSDDVALGDRLACRLMGFEPSLVPLVRAADAMLRRLGTDLPVPGTATISFNGEHVTEKGIPAALGRPFAVPRAWNLTV